MLRSPLILGFSISLVLLALGCGGGINRANVSASPMPEGGTFTGIWHSPQYGEMHLQQTGAQVIGCYTKDERRGRIQGSLEGNLLRFEWSERRELVSGRPITTRGHGYFLYRLGDDGDHYATGQWGHDDNETGGGEWNAVRDRRRTRRPDTDTCGAGRDSGDQQQGDSFEGSGGGGDDFGSGSSGGSDDGLGEL